MVRVTPVKSIRLKCLDCCCDSPAEVRRCSVVNCALHPYRMGRRPRPGDIAPDTGLADD